MLEHLSVTTLISIGSGIRESLESFSFNSRKLALCCKFHLLNTSIPTSKRLDPGYCQLFEKSPQMRFVNTESELLHASIAPALAVFGFSIGVERDFKMGTDTIRHAR